MRIGLSLVICGLMAMASLFSKRMPVLLSYNMDFCGLKMLTQHFEYPGKAWSDDTEDERRVAPVC